MSELENKISRHNQLENKKNLSKHELDELLQLKDDIKNLLDKQIKEISGEGRSDSTTIPKKRKMTLFEYIMAWRSKKKDENKATPDMIKQLELEAQRTELEAKIAVNKKTKAANKTNWLADLKLPGKIFQTDTSSDQQLRRALSSGGNDKDFSKVIGRHKDDDIKL